MEKQSLHNTQLLIALISTVIFVIGVSGGISSPVYAAEKCRGSFLSVSDSACPAECGKAGFSQARVGDWESSGGKRCCCMASRGTSGAGDPGTASFDPSVASALGSRWDVPEIVGGILKAFFGIIGTIALAIFIYGGLLWMTSMGEEDRVKRGRETMIWAGLGLIVVFGSYAVVSFILSTVLK